MAPHSLVARDYRRPLTSTKIDFQPYSSKFVRVQDRSRISILNTQQINFRRPSKEKDQNEGSPTLSKCITTDRGIKVYPLSTTQAIESSGQIISSGKRNQPQRKRASAFAWRSAGLTLRGNPQAQSDESTLKTLVHDPDSILDRPVIKIRKSSCIKSSKPKNFLFKSHRNNSKAAKNDLLPSKGNIEEDLTNLSELESTPSDFKVNKEPTRKREALRGEKQKAAQALVKHFLKQRQNENCENEIQMVIQTLNQLFALGLKKKIVSLLAKYLTSNPLDAISLLISKAQEPSLFGGNKFEIHSSDLIRQLFHKRILTISHEMKHQFNLALYALRLRLEELLIEHCQIALTSISEIITYHKDQLVKGFHPPRTPSIKPESNQVANFIEDLKRAEQNYGDMRTISRLQRSLLLQTLCASSCLTLSEH